VSVAIKLPGALRGYCNGASELTVSVSNVRAALEDVERTYPTLYRCICDETGAVRRHINIWVNTAHIRELDGLETNLAAGDVVFVLPAVSGG
jgi:molybdopterin converting factor small subunit